MIVEKKYKNFIYTDGYSNYLQGYSVSEVKYNSDRKHNLAELTAYRNGYQKCIRDVDVEKYKNVA